MNRKHNNKLTNNAKILRKNMTKEESHLWYDFLRNYEHRFLRQKVIDNYIVDFYCSKAKLAIEIDGQQHNFGKALAYDKTRTKTIETWDILVIRFSNEEINNHFDSVCEYIDEVVKNRINQN